MKIIAVSLIIAQLSFANAARRLRGDEVHNNVERELAPPNTGDSTLVCDNKGQIVPMPKPPPTWTLPSFKPLGADLDGSGVYDKVGMYVAMSSNGNVMAVGAPGDDEGGKTNSGTVKVHTWNATTLAWDKLGNDIIGELTFDESGVVALSADGMVVAVGAAKNDNGGTDYGHVRVHKYHSDTNTWRIIGGDIDGTEWYEKTGTSVALSGDGLILAIGAPYNDDNGSNTGLVRVYEWVQGIDAFTGTWERKGGDVTGGLTYSGNAGQAIDLSLDGKTLAVGAPGNDDTAYAAGHVTVYTWNDTTLAWDKKGRCIDGEGTYDYFGSHVSMSDDGDTIAIGAYGNDGTGPDAGHVRVMRWNPVIQDPLNNNEFGIWEQLGSDIDGELTSEQASTVAISGDGSCVVVGSPMNAEVAYRAGKIRLFQFKTDTWVMGQSFLGDAFGDSFGASVSMSSDGMRFVVGAPYHNGNRGTARAYQLSC